MILALEDKKMKATRFLKSSIYFLFYSVFSFFILNSLVCFGGECLETRDEMLNDFKISIDRVLNCPNQKFLRDEFRSTGYCWNYGDSKYPNDELNEELGEVIIKTLNTPEIPREVRIISLEMSIRAAPFNVFNEIKKVLKNGDPEEKDLAFRGILEIWIHSADRNKDIANFNYIDLFKENLPEEFTPPFKDKEYTYNYGTGSRVEIWKDWWLYSLYNAMGKLYSFEYLKAKSILIEKELYFPFNCNLGRIFQDPRAFEDSNYQEYDFESGLFFSMIRHLEIEFSVEWLKKVKPYQLGMIKSCILATYGWKSKDIKFNVWFNDYIKKVCRNGVCGKVSNIYNEKLLSDNDKKNIDLINKLERN
jgi:hypothetical protein